jgi:lipopolysaccharide transport system permease protein
MGEKLTVYSARWNPRASTLEAVRALAGEIWSHRWHIQQMFWRDFSSAYRLTRFGAVWNYILPLVPISVWVMLNGLRFFPVMEGVKSVVYVTIGVTFWFLFAGFLNLPITTVENRIKEVSRSQMPLIGVVVASFAGLSFDTLVRLSGVVLVFALFHGAPHWQVVIAPIVVIFAALFFVGLGLLLAVFNLAYRDIGKLVSIALSYGMLLSSIVFPLDHIPLLAKISLFNPFYVFVDSVRTLAVFGEIRHPTALFAFSYLGIMLFLFSCRIIYVSQPRLRGFA